MIPVHEKLRKVRQLLRTVTLSDTGLPKPFADRYQIELREMCTRLLAIATQIEIAEGRPTPPAEVVR